MIFILELQSMHVNKIWRKFLKMEFHFRLWNSSKNFTIRIYCIQIHFWKPKHFRTLNIIKFYVWTLKVLFEKADGLMRIKQSVKLSLFSPSLIGVKTQRLGNDMVLKRAARKVDRWLCSVIDIMYKWYECNYLTPFTKPTPSQIIEWKQA